MVTRPQEIRLPLADTQADTIKLNWATAEVQEDILDELRVLRKDLTGKGPGGKPGTKPPHEDPELIRAKRTTESSAATGKFTKRLKKANERLSNFVDNKITRKLERKVGDISDSVQNLDGSVRSVTNSLLRIGGFVGVFAGFLGLAASTLDGLIKVQIEGIKSGFDYQGELINIRERIANVGLNLEEFGQIISEQGSAVRFLGGYGKEAADNFINLIENTHKVSREFGYFGLSTQEMASDMASMTEQLMFHGWTRQEVLEKATDSFVKLNKETLAMSLLTGKSRREILRNQRDAAKDGDAFLTETLKGIGKDAAISFGNLTQRMTGIFGEKTPEMIEIVSQMIKNVQQGFQPFKEIESEKVAGLMKSGLAPLLTNVANSFVRSGGEIDAVNKASKKFREDFEKLMTDEHRQWLLAQGEAAKARPAFSGMLSTVLSWAQSAEVFSKKEVDHKKDYAKYIARWHLVGKQRGEKLLDREDWLISSMSDTSKKANDIRVELVKAMNRLKGAILKIAGVDVKDLGSFDPKAMGDKFKKGIDKFTEYGVKLRNVVGDTISTLGDFHTAISNFTKKLTGLSEGTSDTIATTIAAAVAGIFISAAFRRLVFGAIGRLIGISAAAAGALFGKTPTRAGFTNRAMNTTKPAAAAASSPGQTVWQKAKPAPYGPQWTADPSGMKRTPTGQQWTADPSGMKRTPTGQQWTADPSGMKRTPTGQQWTADPSGMKRTPTGPGPKPTGMSGGSKMLKILGNLVRFGGQAALPATIGLGAYHGLKDEELKELDFNEIERMLIGSGQSAGETVDLAADMMSASGPTGPSLFGHILGKTNVSQWTREIMKSGIKNLREAAKDPYIDIFGADPHEASRGRVGRIQSLAPKNTQSMLDRIRNEILELRMLADDQKQRLEANRMRSSYNLENLEKILREVKEVIEQQTTTLKDQGDRQRKVIEEVAWDFGA